MLHYGPILAVLNTTKTKKRIRIFHTRVKLRYFNILTASLSVLTTQNLLVVCLIFENSVHQDSWFFNMWVYVRTSTVLPSLASFHAIESVDPSIVKMVDIFVSQASENKAFKTKHSVTDVRKEGEHGSISYPVSTLSSMTAITTWEEWKFVFGESNWKLGLKMMNRTHEGNEGKMVRLYNLMPGCVISTCMLNLYLSIRVC